MGILFRVGDIFRHSVSSCPGSSGGIRGSRSDVGHKQSGVKGGCVRSWRSCGGFRNLCGGRSVSSSATGTVGAHCSGCGAGHGSSHSSLFGSGTTTGGGGVNCRSGCRSNSASSISSCVTFKDSGLLSRGGGISQLGGDLRCRGGSSR